MRFIGRINKAYIAGGVAIAGGIAMIAVGATGVGAPLMIVGLCFFMVGGVCFFFGSR
jgi:hypothetical protein